MYCHLKSTMTSTGPDILPYYTCESDFHIMTITRLSSLSGVVLYHSPSTFLRIIYCSFTIMITRTLEVHEIKVHC
jgi:hypothetical protein